MKSHSFIVEHAVELGIEAAIILGYFGHWHIKNSHIESKCIDGHVWCYNSVASFCSIYPYLTERKIRTAITKLIKEGFIFKGNHNKKMYDKTSWYALTKKGCQYLNIPFVKTSNGFVKTSNRSGQNDKPIPVIEPIIEPNNVPFDEFWNLYGKKKKRAESERKWNKLPLKTKEEIMEVLPKYVKQYRPDNTYQPYPTSFLNGRLWEDEIDTPKATTNTPKRALAEL